MNKSKMSSKQEENRISLIKILKDSDWKLRNLEAYDADFILDAELSARKRNSNCIMELNISYENKYVGIAFASFKSGRAEYLVYFEEVDQIEEIVKLILDSSLEMTVKKSIDLAKNLCIQYKDDVFFFNGEESEIIDENSVKSVFDKNQ